MGGDLHCEGSGPPGGNCAPLTPPPRARRIKPNLVESDDEDEVDGGGCEGGQQASLREQLVLSGQPKMVQFFKSTMYDKRIKVHKLRHCKCVLTLSAYSKKVSFRKTLF